MSDKTSKKILIIIANKDFRDEEYFVTKEILDNAGFVTITASDQENQAIGADGGQASVDLKLENVKVEDYDAIVFIGGPGTLQRLDNQTSYQIIQNTTAQNKLLASICISPIILARAGVLKGKNATVWTSTLDKSAAKILKDNGANFIDKLVVQDGKIITANGPEAAKEFGETIKNMLNEDL